MCESAGAYTVRSVCTERVRRENVKGWREKREFMFTERRSEGEEGEGE